MSAMVVRKPAHLFLEEVGIPFEDEGNVSRSFSGLDHETQFCRRSRQESPDAVAFAQLSTLLSLLSSSMPQSSLRPSLPRSCSSPTSSSTTPLLSRTSSRDHARSPADFVWLES